MKKRPLVWLALLVLLVLFIAPRAPANQPKGFAFFRIAATTDTAIVEITHEGWMTWSNATAGSTCVVEWSESLPGATWHTLMDLPVTDILCRAQIMNRPTAERLVSIPGGTFQMGNSQDPNEGWIDELPRHSLSISPFMIDNCEVSRARWLEVYEWATNAGYDFQFAGDGKGPTHPTHTVNWFDCVKWCNARSEMEGLTPVYTTDADLTNVYRSGQVDVQGDWVRWTTNGYRLPTEAEWEYAARGGTPGHRFPWSDTETITHLYANYYSWGSATYEYDVNSTETIGYHQAYQGGDEPYTSPVGQFPENGFGLCDMAGNLWEWCWDYYGDTWYQDPGATQTDTKGPASGSSRVVRGGAWVGDAFSARCAYRTDRGVDSGYNDVGFRCVRNP